MYKKFKQNKDNNYLSNINNTYSRKKNMKKNKGFTLVEIIVSVMLIAIFLVIFGPPIADMFKEVVNSSTNDQSFNNAYNLTTYYASTGGDVEPTDAAWVTCNVAETDASNPNAITIFLYKADGSLVTGKNFTIPAVRYYFAPYDIGSFGNAKKLCFNDYYVKRD